MDRFKFCNFRKYKSKFKLKIFTNKLHFLPQNAGGTKTKSLCTEGKRAEGTRGGGGGVLGIFYDISFLLHNISCLPQFEIFKITDFNGRERESLKVNCIGAMGKFARYFSPVSPSTKAAHNVC